MAVGGTVSKPVFLKDGMYLSLLADNIVTVGNCVQLTTTGTDTCDVGAANTVFIGVAVGICLLFGIFSVFPPMC